MMNDEKLFLYCEITDGGMETWTFRSVENLKKISSFLDGVFLQRLGS